MAKGNLGGQERLISAYSSQVMFHCLEKSRQELKKRPWRRAAYSRLVFRGLLFLLSYAIQIYLPKVEDAFLPLIKKMPHRFDYGQDEGGIFSTEVPLPI